MKAEGDRRDIVVIGGSAGGIVALRKLVAALPADFQAAILVIIHIAPGSPALIAGILASAGKLPADTARNGMPIKPGHIIVAAPDRHLMIQDDHVLLTHGPRENRHRPAIDVLFRSAAVNYGSRVIGVVLSGMLDDGSAGLWSIKQRGGFAIVQDPAEAEYADMPRTAMETTNVDLVLPVAEIAARLTELTSQWVTPTAEAVPPQMAHEVNMAAELNSDIEELDKLGQRTPFTCPECGGTMWEFSDTGVPRYRCHVGHAYSIQSFAAEQSTRVEAALWAAMRSLEENEHLARRLAASAADRGHRLSEKYHKDVASSNQAHAEVLRDLLTKAPERAEPEPRETKPKRKG